MIIIIWQEIMDYFFVLLKNIFKTNELMVLPMIKTLLNIGDTDHNIEQELHISPRLILIFLAIFSFVSVFTINAIGDRTTQVRSALFTLLVYCFTAAAWWLESKRARLSRWFIITLLVTIIFLINNWLGIPGGIILLPVTVLLAAGLIHLPAAAIFTIIDTAILIGLWVISPDSAERSIIPIVLLSIWLTFGIIVAIYQPMYQMANWSYTHFYKVQELLDATRNQRAQQEQAFSDLAQAHRDMALLNDRLAAMRLIAEDAQKAKAAFVAKVSHEFRTPLNMIVGLTDLLVDKPASNGSYPTTDLEKDLLIIQKNCNYLSALVNDVLDLSQVEAGQFTLHREWNELESEINKAIEVVHPLLEKKKLSLNISFSDELPPVYCDITRIRQVILNLVSNATRHTEQGGISISTYQRDNYVVFEVADTGPGISPDDAAKIFEPFYQGSQNQWREREGSGLGLSISKEFVERHGGEIGLESELGIGSKFSFKLPITPIHPQTTGPKRWLDDDWVFLERAAWPQLPDLPNNMRFILCDESDRLFPIISRFDDETEFIITQTFDQSVHEANQAPAHAVIINGSSVDELIKKFDQAQSEISDTPIIGCILSPPTDYYALDAGVADYLIKPIMRADFEEAVGALGPAIKCVLIVDDDADTRKLFERMLLGYDQDIKIITAKNGEKAWIELNKNPIDLVLLDIVMPELDGWQFIERKRADELMQKIPVIIISAEDPYEKPPKSEMLIASIGQGISFAKVLRSSHQLSKIFLEPD